MRTTMDDDFCFWCGGEHNVEELMLWRCVGSCPCPDLCGCGPCLHCNTFTDLHTYSDGGVDGEPILANECDACLDERMAS